MIVSKLHQISYNKYSFVLYTLHMMMRDWNKYNENCFRKSGLMCWDEDPVGENHDMGGRTDVYWVCAHRLWTYISVKALRGEVVRFIIHSQSKEEGGEESDDEPERIPVGKRQACESYVILRRRSEENEATDSSTDCYIVLKMVVMKSSIFRDFTPSSPLKFNRLGGTCRLHLRGRRINQARN
jgi:hypothetical protein